MKKIICLLLTMMMILGIFTGCGKDTEEVEGDKVTLTVGITQDSTIPDYNTNAFTKYIEDAAGVNIKWMYFSGSGSTAKQQLTLMCTSGETLPDVFIDFGNAISHYAVNQFGEDGFIIDLTDLIDKYAVNYKAQLETLSPEMKEFVLEKAVNTKNGEIYAMPTVSCEAVDNLQSIMCINKTWLDRVGMEVPTTIEELEAVCEAFLTQDPNQNGEQDEIPMLGGENLRYWLLNAFVQYEKANFNVTDGKVWDPVYTDEFRQGVEWVSELVEKEYLSELSFTISKTEMKNLITPSDGEGKVGIWVDHPKLVTNLGADNLDEYVAMDSLKDATGLGGYTIIDGLPLEWGAYISCDCKNPEAAMKFIDAFYTDESVSRQRHGEKDVDWYYEEGLNTSGTTSYVTAVNPYVYFDMSANQTLGNVLGIQTQQNYLAVETKEAGYNGETARILKEAWEFMQNPTKAMEASLDHLIYTEEEYALREEKFSAANNYLVSQMTLFMQGEQDASNDTLWNEFLSTMTSLDREELVAASQSAYDRTLAK